MLQILKILWCAMLWANVETIVCNVVYNGKS